MPTDSSGREIKLGAWTVEEDEKLAQLVHELGARHWSKIAEKMPGRRGKQCRERWFNHLDPTVKKEGWSHEEGEHTV